MRTTRADVVNLGCAETGELVPAPAATHKARSSHGSVRASITRYRSSRSSAFHSENGNATRKLEFAPKPGSDSKAKAMLGSGLASASAEDVVRAVGYSLRKRSGIADIFASVGLPVLTIGDENESARNGKEANANSAQTRDRTNRASSEFEAVRMTRQAAMALPPIIKLGCLVDLVAVVVAVRASTTISSAPASSSSEKQGANRALFHQSKSKTKQLSNASSGSDKNSSVCEGDIPIGMDMQVFLTDESGSVISIEVQGRHDQLG